jgi:hypothetical protein
MSKKVKDKCPVDHLEFVRSEVSCQWQVPVKEARRSNEYEGAQ